MPVKHFAQTEQQSKLASPPKPTLHLGPPQSPLHAPKQSPLKTQMDMVTLQVLQEQTSRQIQDLQKFIRTQLENIEEHTQSTSPTIEEHTQSTSPTIEEHTQGTSSTMEQLNVAQPPIPRLTSTSKKSRKLRITRRPTGFYLDKSSSNSNSGSPVPIRAANR